MCICLFLDRHSSFRVFDREDEGKAYESVKQHASTDVNLLGQPKLQIEPRVRFCPRYTQFLDGDVRVGSLVGCCIA